MNGLDVGLGIVQGLQQAKDNMYKTMLAKEKLAQERKKFDLDTKIDEMKLKQLEDSYDPETINLERKANKAAATLRATMFEKANKELDSNLQQSGNFISQAQSVIDNLASSGIDVGKYGFRAPSRTEMTQRSDEDNFLKFQNWVTGAEGPKLSKDAMYRLYPLDRQTVDEYEQQIRDSQRQEELSRILSEPIKKKPIQQVGFLSPARAKSGYAHMDDATQAMAQRINEVGTYEAIADMIANRDELEAAGVNVSALEDYYRDEINHLISKGVLKVE